MSPIRTISLLLAVMATGPAWPGAPGPASGEAFFRCTDASGQAHFADHLPPACQGLDTQVLNERGTVVRVIEGEQSRAARLEREAADAAARKEREEQALRDRMLVDTYLTVEDIERLRDQRLEMLGAQLDVTRQNIGTLQERQARLQQQIARFRPYSDQANAPPLPEHLAEEMVNTVNSLETYRQAITTRQAEQETLRLSFERDIARFKELKGIR